MAVDEVPGAFDCLDLGLAELLARRFTIEFGKNSV